MISPLTLFYRCYQTSEESQTVNLRTEKERFLFPKGHADASKVYEAAPEISLEDDDKTRIEYVKNSGQFFRIVGTGWLLRHSRFSTRNANVPGAPPGPGSSSVLRPVMNGRLGETIQEHQLNLITPEEYLVEVPRPKGRRMDSDDAQYYKEFVVISQELKILGYHETVARFENIFKE